MTELASRLRASQIHLESFSVGPLMMVFGVAVLEDTPGAGYVL